MILPHPYRTIHIPQVLYCYSSGVIDIRQATEESAEPAQKEIRTRNKSASNGDVTPVSY